MCIPLMRIPNRNRRCVHRTRDIPASIGAAAQVDVTCYTPLLDAVEVSIRLGVHFANGNNCNYVVNSYIIGIGKAKTKGRLRTMTHYIITYYLKIDDMWYRIVRVFDDMYEMIGFLEGIAEHDDERLVSVETT